MLIAQLTDTHIKARGERAYGRVDTAAALSRAVAVINALGPPVDAVFVTGDLTDRGTAEEFDHLRALLTPLKAPWYLAMGNHDARPALRAAFEDHPYLQADSDFVQYSVALGRWDVLVLDTTVAGKPYGALCPDRLAWLDATLRQGGERPALVMQHHPPFDTGIRHMDVQRLLDGAETELDILRRHNRVRHLACGHVHRPVTAVSRGVSISIAPSPAHAVTLALEPDAPESFTLEPPLIRLFRLSENGDLITHLAPVGAFDGPHPFRGADGRWL